MQHEPITCQRVSKKIEFYILFGIYVHVDESSLSYVEVG